MTHLAFLFWVNWVWFFGFLGDDKFGFLILMGLTWVFFPFGLLCITLHSLHVFDLASEWFGR